VNLDNLDPGLSQCHASFSWLAAVSRLQAERERLMFVQGFPMTSFPSHQKVDIASSTLLAVDVLPLCVFSMASWRCPTALLIFVKDWVAERVAEDLKF